MVITCYFSMSDKRVLVISAIVMVAVVMGMSAVAPAMAGNHGSVPPVDTCDAIDNPSDSKSGGNADTGKDKAKENNDCAEV